MNTTKIDLRDWFAGKVLEGIISSMSGDNPIICKAVPNNQKAAKYCYALADAMLAEREKPISP